MQVQVGIILKKRMNRITVLNSHLGKLKLLSMDETLCVGALIQYQLVSQKQMLIRNVETMMLPLHLAQDDILFFHLVLELSFYFLSEVVPSADVFQLLQFLYHYSVRPLTILFKKVFIAKLLLLCGAYPEHQKFQGSYFKMLISESVDIIVDRGLDLRFERCLDEWLFSCVSMHPSSEYFKTIYFLAESRVL